MPDDVQTVPTAPLTDFKTTSRHDSAVGHRTVQSSCACSEKSGYGHNEHDGVAWAFSCRLYTPRHRHRKTFLPLTLTHGSHPVNTTSHFTSHQCPKAYTLRQCKSRVVISLPYLSDHTISCLQPMILLELHRGTELPKSPC